MLVEEERPRERRLPIEEDGRFSYILSSNDLCMLEHLDDLAEAGVTAIKLEGRAKGAFYTAMITNAYRHVLDGEPASDWMGELETTSHRPFSTGFFYGNPTQNPGDVDYLREARMVATVVRCSPADDLTGSGRPSRGGSTGEGLGQSGPSRASGTKAHARESGYLVEVLCRNKAQVGDPLQAVCAGQPVRGLRLEGLEHWDALAGWERATVLSRAMERYRFWSPFPMRPLDIIRA